MSIRVFYDEVSFRLKGWSKVVEVLNNVVLNSGKITGDISVIITDDQTLREINVQFLKHNYFTDVITFNYCIENVVNGEIYISINTIERNAFNYNVSLKEEVRRVIIHGILHLVGYDDKLKRDKILMKEKEDFWLGEFKD